MKNFPDGVPIATGEDLAIASLAQKTRPPADATVKDSSTTFAAPDFTVALPGTHTVKSSKPTTVIEHIRKHYSNYLTMANRQTWHSGVMVLFQELLNNSIDEYLQGYGKMIEVLCSSESITIRDYGRGILHTRLRAEVQELGQSLKINSAEVQFCEGFSGLGLKLVNALSSRFLLRSYREHKFAEIESAKGVILRDRQGRCNKEAGTFIRFTPEPEIFGKQSVRIPQLFDMLCKLAALYPGLKIRWNQTHLITQKGVGDLFHSLPQWRKFNYFYDARSLRGQNWQLSFAHLAEWQGNDSGLYNERLVQSFVNGHACAGGLAGGLHIRQLQGAFLGALRQVFPEKEAQVNAFWDKGITLFWGLNLVEPGFQDLGKTHLLGAEGEVAAIAHECREQLLELLWQDKELKAKLEKLLDNYSLADEQGEYSRRQSRLTGDLREVEEQARKLDGMLHGSEEKYAVLDRNLHTVLNESEEIQKHWKEVSSHLMVDIGQTEHDLNELKKLQRAEQRRYRKEEEKRLQGLEEEQQAYRRLKDGLQQQSGEQLAKEQQRQKLIHSGLQNWNRLEQALEDANALQKQRDLEQEQILQYLRSAKSSTESEVGTIKQNIKLTEQKMLQRQESYLRNFQDNARDEFETIHDEIEGRKQELRVSLDEGQQKAYEELQKLHNRFSESLTEENKRWQEQLEQAGQNSQEEWQRRMEQRKQELERLDKNWSEQEAVLEEQRQKQGNFLERWQEWLDEGRREAQTHQKAQHELVRNRKELEAFFTEQEVARNEQISQYEAQKGQQEEWKQRLEKQQQEIEQVRTRQLESLGTLGLRLEREIEQEVQQRLSDWLGHFEKLGQESEQHLITQQKLLQTKQQTLENELVLVQQDFGNAKKEMTKQLAKRKEEWEQRQEILLKEFDKHLEKLKQKQYTQQYCIEEAQIEQSKILKQLQKFQSDADERMSGLNKNLSNYTVELHKEIETSITELRSNTDHQFIQMAQSTQDEARLYQQGLLEREQASHNLLEQYQKDFDEKLGKQYKALDQWSENFAKRFEEQKQALHKSLDEFSKDLQEKQQENLSGELEQWSDKFLAEQSSKEKQAAGEAQRKRSQFWREQQLATRDEALQQREEFQELHKQLQATMERERERLHKELGHLQQLTQQQEEYLESLNQNLLRDVEQRSERLKQEMEENYRQFYEEILDNTRELHHINSDERKALRDDLANMHRDIDDLNATINLSEQTLANLQKALPDSLKLQKSMEGLAKKEKFVREVEKEIVHLQNTLNENSQIGQKTSEQLVALLARRNELSDMEQQMEQVLELSGDLYQQRESLEQQQQKISSYQGQLDKLEYLYNESSDLLELFDQRKDQLLGATSLLHGYTNDLGSLEQKIQVMQEQLQPLEFGFGKAQELQQELAQQQQQLQSTQGELRQMQQALTELHEDSQGIDKMREWIAKTETRMLELSQDIQNNLRTVETIVRKNRHGERSAHGGSKVDSDVRNTVIQLYSKNWSSSEIARATQLSVGEVELILEMLSSAS